MARPRYRNTSEPRSCLMRRRQNNKYWSPPVETDDGLTGYPGLRACAYRRHVELYLLDSDPAAVVQPAQVFWGLWREVSEGHWLSNCADPLSPAEQDSLARKECAPQLVGTPTIADDRHVITTHAGRIVLRGPTERLPAQPNGQPLS
jgi:hypothetical protein